MEKKRIVWIELLRIAACVGVLGIHAGSQHFRDMPVDSTVWQVSNFYHGINRFAVACFIMISGSLYLSSKRTWDLKKLWQRNILPVASAYLFWQLFYGFYRIAVNGGPKIGSMEFLKNAGLCEQAVFPFVVSSYADGTVDHYSSCLGNRKQFQRKTMVPVHDPSFSCISDLYLYGRKI